MIANPITLKNFFEKDNMLTEVGGTEYLVKLTRFSSSTKQVGQKVSIDSGWWEDQVCTLEKSKSISV